jgi:hypothetical protein
VLRSQNASNAFGRNHVRTDRLAVLLTAAVRTDL